MIEYKSNLVIMEAMKKVINYQHERAVELHNLAERYRKFEEVNRLIGSESTSNPEGLHQLDKHSVETSEEAP